MSKIVKISLIVIGSILILLIVLPLLFIGKIESKIKSEVNKQLNATVGWEDISLSLISSFPNLKLGIENLSVVGKGQFEKDTLAGVGNLDVTINLNSAFGGTLEIKKISVDNLLVNTIIAADSAVNWDIMIPSTQPEEVGDTTASNFMANLQEVVISNGRFYFIDKSMDLVFATEGINAVLGGDLSVSQSELNIDASVDKMSLIMEKSSYLRNVPVKVKTGLLTDLDKFVFTFKNADLLINQLALGIDGSFGMPTEGYDLDMKIFARKTVFKTLLGILPAEMLKDFDKIKTSGSLALELVLKGLYVDTDHMPAFDFLLAVENASIKYPDLPESVNDIQILTKINNPGGSLDSTTTDISKFHFIVANNPFDAWINVKTPISNAAFKGGAKGTIDLSSIKKALPLDSMDLKGIISANINIAGDAQMVEKEQYEQIKADGSMGLTNFVYTASDLPMPVYIDKATLNFSPKYLELANFSSRLGKSDFDLAGRIENYLAYALKDGVLKGSLNHSSKNIDVDELMALSGPEHTAAIVVADTSKMEVVLIPKNIDFVLQSNITKLKYDKLVMDNAKGKITIKEGRLIFDGLNVDMLGGRMAISGQYNTQDEKKPFIDMVFDASKINISQAVNSFSVIDSMLPIAKLANGIINTKLNYSSVLGNDMMPLTSSILGFGNISSESIEIKGSKVQAGLVSLLKDEKFNTLTAKDLLMKFKIENGNILVSPFNTNVNGKAVTFEGRQGIDKSMDYKMGMKLTREEIAKYSSALGANFMTNTNELPIEVLIKGTVGKPKLSLNISQASQQVKEELKKEAEKIIEKEAEKAVEQLSKDPEIKKGVEDAKKRLKNLIK